MAAYVLYFCELGYWVITTGAWTEPPAANRWQGGSEICDPLGNYEPQGTYTGTAVVTWGECA
jgi:hypothetical protein